MKITATATSPMRYAAEPGDAEHATGLVRDAVKRRGSTSVAKQLAVDEGTVRAWMSGKSSPRPKRVHAIVTMLGKPTRKPVEKPEAREVVIDEAEVADAKANAIATLRVLRRALEGAEPEQVPRIANAVTSCSRLLARLSGQLDVTEAQILRSAAWQRAKKLLGDVLSKYEGAAAEFEKAIAEFEGQA